MHRSISKKQLNLAVEIINNGGLVALPTETVYGLAADGTNPDAVKKIFSAKGRPADHPLILHLADANQLNRWAKNIPDYAYQLAKSYWPGPMTLILKKQPHVLDLVTGGQNTVGLRVPNHPIAQKVLQTLNEQNKHKPVALAAPSANSFGRISPTLAEHVQEDLGDKVNLILDGGSCSIGIESTIIDCTRDQPRILRPGVISEIDIKNITGLTPLEKPTSDNTNNPAPRVSGDLKSHYAPNTTTVLVNPIELNSYCEKFNNYVVLSREKPSISPVKIYDARIPTSYIHKSDHPKNWILMPEDYAAYAHCLYEQLHLADHLRCEQIIVEDVPKDNIHWAGIRDRLLKASYKGSKS